MSLWLSLPAAAVIGFITYWVYAPGATVSVEEGMLKIVATMMGTLIAYYVWYR